MTTDELKKVLEPAASAALYSHEEAIHISIAISLRRIADAMNEQNEYGEGPAKAIGAGISRALQSHQ